MQFAAVGSVCLCCMEPFDEHMHIDHFVAESSVASPLIDDSSCGPSLHRVAGH